MRNPLKKLQKKINVRLANNAAKHSQQPIKSPEKGPRLSDRSLTEQETDDPLFNNRSSKLRLALAESKKTNNAQETNTSNPNTPTKKKGRGRVSIGSSSDNGMNSSSRRNADNASDQPSVRKKSSSIKEVDPRPRAPMSRPTWGPRGSYSSHDAPQQQQSKQEVKRKASDPNLERIAKAAAALDNTGNELFERGEYDKAMASYVKALKLKNRTLAGRQQMDDKNPIAAGSRPKLPEPKTNSSSTNPCDLGGVTPKPGDADELWISVATSINNIGYLRQQSGQASAEETMQAYKNSLEIKRRVLGNDNLSVGKTLNNLGTVHYLKREYEAALEAYQEALEIMMATLGPTHLDVGTVHSNMGDVYWAKAGEVKESFQSSRNAALQHYRRALEIRWEQLHNHHDPKVIRLLEKIAALEMGESFLALVQNNHKLRQVPKDGAPKPTDALESSTDQDADEALEAESSKPVHVELQTLHEEVRVDVQQMDMAQRKLAIDMVKDKLRLMREMKKLANLDLYASYDEDDDISLGSGARTPVKAPPLSPLQRTEALCAVKERLKELRDSRAKEAEPYRRLAAPFVSDLKEADRSPNNYVLSERASQLLNGKAHQPPSIDGLDELRKFTFNTGNENDPEEKEGTEPPKPAFDLGRKESHRLDDGIDALRSLSVNQANMQIPHGIPKAWNPWVVAATMASSPEKSISSQPSLSPPSALAEF